ncbi:hypothetical protein R1sor_022244 [Riccia sorocarpa]|uniref:Uncharacterized protein n=1 Tax=Riccia sorocarpa TaxID=122646 RepID=A0ABD3GJB8_9MARC
MGTAVLAHLRTEGGNWRSLSEELRTNEIYLSSQQETELEIFQRWCTRLCLDVQRLEEKTELALEGHRGYLERMEAKNEILVGTFNEGGTVGRLHRLRDKLAAGQSGTNLSFMLLEAIDRTLKTEGDRDIPTFLVPSTLQIIWNYRNQRVFQHMLGATPVEEILKLARLEANTELEKSKRDTIYNK